MSSPTTHCRRRITAVLRCHDCKTAPNVSYWTPRSRWWIQRCPRRAPPQIRHTTRAGPPRP
eukprot:3700763-Prymnesium_polylepis.1